MGDPAQVITADKIDLGGSPQRSKTTTHILSMTETLTLKSHIPSGEKNVSIGGGGYVTGICLHPQQQDLVYIKTDVGGFYRWNSTQQNWIPLTDSFPLEQSNYYGGEALALDPNNPNIIYIAVGKHTADWAGNGTIFKSTNQGETWTKLNLNLKMGGNENHRWLGERLAVNPNNSNQLLFGSRLDGLWRSIDAGITWSQVVFGGVLAAGVGITAIAYSRTTPGLVYAVAYNDGIYQSTDAGLTWAKMVGSPVSANRLAVANNGTLYVSSTPGVYKFANNTWTNITPSTRLPNQSFVALAVNPNNPNQVITAIHRPSANGIFLSNNGGTSWAVVNLTITNTPLWRNSYMNSLPQIAAIEFDLFNPNKLWLTDWFGVYQTNNVNSNPAVFESKEKAIEQTVIFDLSAPPTGYYLLSGLADLDGLKHQGLNTSPQSQLDGLFQDTYSLDYCKVNPSKIVRVGGTRNTNTYTGATSTNGGNTWTQFATFPVSTMATRVAISATDVNNFVVLTSNKVPIFTLNNGATWANCTGLPTSFTGPWNWSQPLCSDAVDGNIFYFYKEGKIYKTVDKGASWTVINSVLGWESTWCSLRNIPGELWLSLNNGGLYRSTNGGITFTRIPSVTKARLLDFGKPKPGTSTPILYLHGVVSGLGEGIFMSPDLGVTWIKQGTKQIGNDPNCLEASKAFYGLFFVGTNGRGIYYGNA